MQGSVAGVPLANAPSTTRRRREKKDWKAGLWALLFLGPNLALFGLFKFFYRQVGVDHENVYVMRQRWIMKRIPIDNIADIQIRENQMRVYAFVKDPEVPKQVFKTNKYVRNRGVMLRLIREIYDIRRNMDAVPIPGLQAAPRE